MYEVLPIDNASAEEDDRLESLNWEVEDLFDACGIRMASYDEPIFGIEIDGDLAAALVGGAAYGDPWSGMRFSVCVAEEHRRKGLARTLIEAFIAYCGQDGLPVEAWVVNEEAMIPLLEDLGFSRTDEAIWTL